MSATITDPTEDIADALVGYTNQLPELSLSFEASKPEDPQGEIRLEHQGVKVFFVPQSESQEEKIGRGGQAVMSYAVDMVVVRKLTHPITRQAMSLLVRQITTQLRGKRQAGFSFTSADIVVKFDQNILHEMNQFVSQATLTYMGTD